MTIFPICQLGRGRVFLLVYCVVWLLMIPVVWVYWDSMSIGIRTIAIFLELFLAPDISVIRDAFGGKESEKTSPTDGDDS
jgi:hypothetical protein